jgi:hypothetical protein
MRVLASCSTATIRSIPSCICQCDSKPKRCAKAITALLCMGWLLSGCSSTHPTATSLRVRNRPSISTKPARKKGINPYALLDVTIGELQTHGFTLAAADVRKEKSFVSKRAAEQAGVGQVNSLLALLYPPFLVQYKAVGDREHVICWALLLRSGHKLHQPIVTSARSGPKWTMVLINASNGRLQAEFSGRSQLGRRKI